MILELSDKGSLTWELTPDLMGILDASGIFRETNPAWLKTLGLEAKDVKSKFFMDFVHPDDVAPTETAFHELQQGKSVLSFENRYRHSDGTYRWLMWNAVPVDDVYFCSARDITTLKASQAALRDRDTEAALREQFIAVLGHDLRNPLAALSSGMNILRRKYDAEEDRILMQAMQGSVRRMAELIDDVMDFARARLGDGIARHEKEFLILTPSLEQAVQELRAAHPSFEIVESYRFHEPVMCEPARIAQLLSNLVANAITHGSPTAPIRVDAWDEGALFFLSVTNSGSPIPDAARPMMFQPFARAHVRESQNGLGLGLFISSEIAKGHDGTLTFTSDDDKTVFIMSMPKGAAPLA